MSFLDRVNLSYAAADMTRELKFGPHVYGLGAGLFFIGYLLLEVPVTRLVAQGSPRFWLALMLAAWGTAATAMGFINSVTTFYACRILLGVAEAGFFPGIIVYLSRWFPPSDRARAVGALAVGLPAANLLGAPVSGLLLAQHWFHIAGWRWLFILEGFPSVLLGFVAYKFLDDSPSEAKWLSLQERVWLKDTLSADAACQDGPTKSPGLHVVTLPLLLFALVWFLDNIGVYGFNFWLPLMISKFSGFGSSAVALIAATPFVGALVAAGAVSLSSDRSGERRLHTALQMATFAVGLMLSVLCRHEPLLALAMLCVGALGLTSGTPGFWALVTGSRLTSNSFAVAIITSAGALGGFCGPYVMGSLRSATGGFAVGIGLLSGAVLTAAALVLVASQTVGGQPRLLLPQRRHRI